MGQLHRQLIVFVLILIIGVLYNIHGKHLLVVYSRGLGTQEEIFKNHGRPYLLYSSYEINILMNSIQNRLGLFYTTLLINCHSQTYGKNSVSRSTVNLAFRILQKKFRKYNRVQRMREIGNSKGIDK